MEVVTKPGKFGCEGCYYENQPTCPADPEEHNEKLKFDFSVCMDYDNYESLIFVPKDVE